MRIYLSIAVGVAASCVPPPPPPRAPIAVSGGSLLVDFNPVNRPALVGTLDFELLAGGKAKACADRGSASSFWVGMADLEKISRDPLTRQAIAAALTDAITRLDDVDAILLTSVVTEAKGPDRVCATVAGRGIRLTKAPTAASPAASGQPAR